MMHARKPSVALITVMLLATAGCHSKSAPNAKNFTTGLNAYFLEHSECLFPDAPHFPYETSDPVRTKQMNALVDSKLLKVALDPTIHVSRYTTTVTGARFAPRFCYGHRVVSSIDSFTPPAQKNGFPETQVDYHYTVEDIPIWAKSEAMRAAFPALAKAEEGPQTAKATLAGTMAGWQVPD